MQKEKADTFLFFKMKSNIYFQTNKNIHRMRGNVINHIFPKDVVLGLYKFLQLINKKLNSLMK